MQKVCENPTSFQTDEREKLGNPAAEICNYFVSILFTGFFINEYLDGIITRMCENKSIKGFYKIGKKITRWL